METTGCGKSRHIVFVVDDEPYVLGTVCQILARAGYSVLSASSPEEAKRIARVHDSPIDLLLTDVVIPGLSGPGLADAIFEMHPETQVLFMAGLPDQPDVVEGVIARGSELLPKPFLPQVLIQKVRSVLSASNGQSRAAAV